MYQTLFHKSNDAIFVHQPVNGNEPGNFIEVNRIACKRYGYSKEEFLTLTPRDIDDSKNSSHVPERIRILFETNHILFETVHKTKDGNVIPVEINAHLFHLNGTPTIISVARDIAERKRQEQELINQKEQLRQMAHRLSEAEENERHRIAGELHDLAGQNLASLSINLNLIDSLLPEGISPVVNDRLKECRALVEQTSSSIRSVMADLRPPVLDDYGLSAALSWYGKLYSRRTGIDVDMSLEEMADRFPVFEELALFRIVQEAMTNVLKHAKVGRLFLYLTVEDGKMMLSVRDHGIGFDDNVKKTPGENGGWGFSTMRERAVAVNASVRISSGIGEGTTVTVCKDINQAG